MKLSMTDRVVFNNFDSAFSQKKAAEKKAGGFDVEMFNSALTRLKSALGNRDTNLINQTIDIMLDFSQNDGVKATVRGISKLISKCDYDQAEAMLETLA